LNCLTGASMTSPKKILEHALPVRASAPDTIRMTKLNPI
jgi:hypothetical protein